MSLYVNRSIVNTTVQYNLFQIREGEISTADGASSHVDLLSLSVTQSAQDKHTHVRTVAAVFCQLTDKTK